MTPFSSKHICLPENAKCLACQVTMHSRLVCLLPIANSKQGDTIFVRPSTNITLKFEYTPQPRTFKFPAIGHKVSEE